MVYLVGSHYLIRMKGTELELGLIHFLNLRLHLMSLKNYLNLFEKPGTQALFYKSTNHLGTEINIRPLLEYFKEY